MTFDSGSYLKVFLDNEIIYNLPTDLSRHCILITLRKTIESSLDIPETNDKLQNFLRNRPVCVRKVLLSSMTLSCIKRRQMARVWGCIKRRQMARVWGWSSHFALHCFTALPLGIPALKMIYFGNKIAKVSAIPNQHHISEEQSCRYPYTAQTFWNASPPASNWLTPVRRARNSCGSECASVAVRRPPRWLLFV